MPAPTFVRLTYLADGFTPTDAWVNPERIAYLQVRLSYRGADRVATPVGTRIFFAEDGMVGRRQGTA